MNKSGFIYGTFLLIFSNLIVRLISFSYDIVLCKLIGAEGIGIFHMLMPLFMIFLIITTGGIPTAVSKLASEYDSMNNVYGTRKVFRVALFITCFIAVLLICLIIMFSPYFSHKIFKSINNITIIYSLAPAILIISLTSLIRGYFYGKKKIIISSISEIIEHIARFILVMILIHYFNPVFSKNGAFVAIIGISLGEIFSLLWLVFNYIRCNSFSINTIQNEISTLSISKKIGIVAIPLTLSGIFNVSFQFINALLLPQKLMESGYANSEAVAIFGRIMGMTMPLVSLPFIVTSALVINIIPSLSSHFRLKEYAKAKKVISYAIKITFLVAMPLTAIYASFPRALALYLYNDIEAGKFIFVMGMNTIFLSLQHTLSGILNGIGKQINASINRFWGMCFLVLCIYFLVGIESISINGYFIGFIGSIFIICLSDFYILNKKVSVKINIIDIVVKPLISSIIMISVIIILYRILFLYGFTASIIKLICLLFGFITYLLVIIAIKALPLSFFKIIIPAKDKKYF